MDRAEEARDAGRVDAAALSQLSRAMSGESARELVESALREAVAHAGADRGLFLVAHDRDLQVRAEATATGGAIAFALRDAPVSQADAPRSLISSAAQARETVALHDVSGGGPFAEDEYFRRAHHRSVACVPLVVQGRTTALLFLENDQLAGAFTPARIAVLEVLASLAAASLDNRRLTAELAQGQARLDRAQRIAHVGYWERDLDAGCITLSHESCRIFGLPAEERVEPLDRWHARWLSLLHPDDRRTIEQTAAAALQGGPKYDVEYRIVQPGGEVRTLRSWAEVARDATGRPRAMLGVMQDITEMRRAEHDLRVSESRFRTFVDHALDAFFLHDDELFVVDVNRRACESLGYSREELIGMHPREFDVGVCLDPSSVTRLLAQVGDGETVTFESVQRRKDGTVFPVEVRGCRFEQGAHRLRLSLVRDITDRKAAEDERRAHVWFLESMDRVHRAIRGTDDLERMLDAVLGEVLAIFECDRAFFASYLGEPEAATLAVTAARTRPGVPGELVSGGAYGMDADARVVPGALRDARGPVQFTPGSEPPLPRDLTVRFGIGSMLCMPVFSSLDVPSRVCHFALARCSSERAWTPHEVRLFDEIGRRLNDAVSLLSSLRDLRQSESRFRSFVDFAADAFMLHDEDARVVDANRQACDSLGYSREEVIGMTPTDFDAGLDAESLRRIRERVGAGEILTFETRHRRKDGTTFPVEVRGRQIELGDRRFVLTVTRDISERKRAEEERERLRQAQADLARISRVTTMGELTASLAHEIKQPIAAAMTNANACKRWLTRTQPDLGEARDAAGRMLQDAKRAAEIIDRVRAVFKKDAPRREPVEINEVLRETVALLRSEASRHAVHIRTDLAPDLPRVAGDRVQLQQVVVNLMLNGIEAMDVSPGELTVTSRRGPGGEPIIAVSDEGVGLPCGKADAIFDAFFTTKPQGTGMGLAISRSIIEAHGGRLWAKPRDGRGTTFEVALPAAGPDLAVGEAAGGVR